MYLLSHVPPFPFSADLRQNTILFHDSKYSFGIAVDPLTFQPKMHPTVTVGLETVFLLQTQLLCQGGVFLRPAQTLYMIVVAASGHAKEPAHSRYGILCLMTIDDLVFELRLHILSMSERKSRSN